MIKLVASSMPKRNEDNHVFVEYENYLFWLTYTLDGRVMSGFKPGRTIAECLQAFDHTIEDMPKISELYVEYIPSSIKEKIISAMLKNKEQVDGNIKVLEELIQEQEQEENEN